jgi:hypothetical protein
MFKNPFQSRPCGYVGFCDACIFIYLNDDSRRKVRCIKEVIIINIQGLLVNRKKEQSVFQIKTKYFLNPVVSLETSVIYIGIVKRDDCRFLVTINILCP